MDDNLRGGRQPPSGQEAVHPPKYEPYTTPKDYKAPTMKEQWLYATTRHPYAKYGYAAAFAVGLACYALVTINRVEDVHKRGVAARQNQR